LGCDSDKPVSFVFHGGSGSSLEDIRYAIEAGVVKMNIDTDTCHGQTPWAGTCHWGKSSWLRNTGKI
jgi:fructose/tagatose bisphosphate aldolase